ncbi:MAG TPA: BlaI/MecI/CopY family transcriptional regulator [Terriglobia bacterium]|jgi:predicted transcriptional regulator
MGFPKLSKLELQIMDTLWDRGECSIREIQEAFPEKGRPGFTTVQTMVYRLEAKNALRCTKRIGKANIFEAAISRKAAQTRMIDELLNLFGGKPVMAHMVKSGQLTLEDVKEAEQELRRLAKKEKAK